MGRRLAGSAPLAKLAIGPESGGRLGVVDAVAAWCRLATVTLHRPVPLHVHYSTAAGIVPGGRPALQYHPRCGWPRFYVYNIPPPSPASCRAQHMPSTHGRRTVNILVNHNGSTIADDLPSADTWRGADRSSTACITCRVCLCLCTSSSNTTSISFNAAASVGCVTWQFARIVALWQA